MASKKKNKNKRAVTILVVLISVGLILPSFAGIISTIGQ